MRSSSAASLAKALMRTYRAIPADCVWSKKARAWIRAEGHDACDYPELPQRIGEMQFVFNTVPSMVIDEALLCITRPEEVANSDSGTLHV